MTHDTAVLIVGWLLGVGCMLLREHYANRRHNETVRALRRRVLADAEASRPAPKVLATGRADREAASHAESRARRVADLETR
jgi:hypothetical protein